MPFSYLAAIVMSFVLAIQGYQGGQRPRFRHLWKQSSPKLVFVGISIGHGLREFDASYSILACG
jgi:hypothetical protein